MTAYPACLILPSCWNQYEGLIRHGLEKHGVEMTLAFQRICQRNRQLYRSAADDVCYSRNIELHQIITILDEFSLQADLASIARSCLEVFKDHSSVISTCLLWASNPSRNRSFRIHIVVRLLRTWSELHIEVEGPLLDFLTFHIEMTQFQRSNVYKLLAELVHSKHMSVSKYLQRLMAKGSLAAYKKRDGVRVSSD